MHLAKRRKLDQPQPFQNKPFRSPLRTVSKPQEQPTRVQLQSPETYTSVIYQPTPLLNSTASPNTSQNPPASGSILPLGAACIKPADLQKQHTALSLRLTQLRQSLENADQALQIEESGQNTELKRLITKWRAAAQEAADELFADARERIDAMGGVGAWRRRANEDSQRWNDDAKESLPQIHAKSARDVEYAEECLATDERGLSEPERDDDDNSFTMKMMLHQMNIDLQAIGFDKQLERWVD
ncbi:hypothetical protein PV04_02587 [Phialophora macrospora]|uniref:Swi5-dependent recombination DNA repair protein 1 n=1 Tax=Phialophora macrospora TaxID=1851006 RepID=A0A0D2E7J4_9EURO|nr:hypothetical protein PV04_02587 [Phialophora macrospora]